MDTYEKYYQPILTYYSPIHNKGGSRKIKLRKNKNSKNSKNSKNNKNSKNKIMKRSKNRTRRI